MNDNSPDPGPRTPDALKLALGLQDDKSRINTSVGVSYDMEGNVLDTFKSSYDAFIEASHQAQINALRECFHKAICEKASKEVALARRNLLAEREAMRRRLELHAQHMWFQITLAENTSSEVARWAITETSDQYSTELKRALEAQKNLYREN